MATPFSYEEYSQQELELFLLMARKGDPSLPVYSEDIAAAFQIRHRFLKDCIEQHFRPLRSAYGRRVHRIKEKRGGGMRAMNGYMLPFRAVLQVLYQVGLMQHCPELRLPEFFHLCFSPDTFEHHLN